MKKLIAIIIMLLCFSCTKEGTITNQSARHLKINGKEYRFIKVVPADGETAVWLLVPSDSSIDIPQVISYRYSCGKSCSRYAEVIWIKS